MGCSYELRCKNCGYMEVFRFGLGFLYNREILFDFSDDSDLLKRLVATKSNYDKLRELIINHHAMVSPDYGHDIYRCEKCGNFHEGFYLHLDYDEGEFEPYYECHECNSELKRVEVEESDICIRWHLDIRHDKYPCPMCGAYSLKRGFSISS